MSQYGKQIGQLFSPRLTYVEHMLQEKEFLITQAMYNYSIRVIKTYSHPIKSKYYK